MIKRLCLGGERVASLVGRAGTGKTFSLGVARVAWQDGGHAVLGVAVARRAADELRTGAGIASTSVAALMKALHGTGEKLPKRCVLVVDEAGMVPTRQLAVLLDLVEAADGKLVLVATIGSCPRLRREARFAASSGVASLSS
jgi:ATP-dependent exoDNAse (exonuclease V) alpha subunit